MGPAAPQIRKARLPIDDRRLELLRSDYSEYAFIPAQAAVATFLPVF